MNIESWIVLLSILSCASGLIFGLFNYLKVAKIKMRKRGPENPKKKKKGDLLGGEKVMERTLAETDYDKLVRAGDIISSSAMVYLLQEYAVLGTFIGCFGLVIYVSIPLAIPLIDAHRKISVLFLAHWRLLTRSHDLHASRYVLRLFTLDFVGLHFAVIANVRTVKKARKDMEKAFLTTLRAGFAIGFSIVSLGVLSLVLIISSYMSSYITAQSTEKDYGDLFMTITGYALGASVVALFGRVGGGIFTKAADVGVDLTSGKGPEDVEKNPGIVADYVGDNVGDVVGTGSDLFASFAESVCATMVLSVSAPVLLNEPQAIYFPILVFSAGIVVSMLTVAISSRVTHGESSEQVERILKNQPFVGAVLMTPILFALCQYCLPDQIQFQGESYITTKHQIFACTVFGLWGGYLIGLSSEYFTSHDYYPVQEVAKSCHTGSATDIIYGLALGYMSTIFPIAILVVVIYISYICAAMYGVAVATCGMLSTLAIILSVSSCGPIADNASGLSKMCNLDYAAIQTEDLHTAAKAVSAHGRSFAIGSSTILALALFGAFTTRQGISIVDILQPIEFSGLIIGAMLPYAFSAQILQSVSRAAGVIEKEINDQKADIASRGGEPDYHKCIRICTSASLQGMIVPTLIVVGTPLIAGIIFGPVAICGVLAGTIVSGVQIGISFINSGVAWDNAKKYIEGMSFIINNES